jgi:hypothetical protein
MSVRLKLGVSRVPMPSKPAMCTNSKASLVISVGIAVTLFKGIDLLMQAAAWPLETALTRLVNALLARGWPNAIMLNESHHPLVMVTSSAIGGIVLLTVGLVAGNKLILRGRTRE